MTPRTQLTEIERLADFLQHKPHCRCCNAGWMNSSCPPAEQTMAQMKNPSSMTASVSPCSTRLPMEACPIDSAARSLLAARPVHRPPGGAEVEWANDVRRSDTGAEYAYGTRGSYTSVELNFHTDNAFARMPPDYVGLFCRHPAKTGGISRFCSLYSVHQRMLEQYPDELARLYQPVLFDRQKEHREDAEKVCFAPCFSWRNGRMFARANASLIRKGYEVAESNGRLACTRRSRPSMKSVLPRTCGSRPPATRPGSVPQQPRDRALPQRLRRSRRSRTQTPSLSTLAPRGRRQQLRRSSLHLVPGRVVLPMKPACSKPLMVDNN